MIAFQVRMPQAEAEAFEAEVRKLDAELSASTGGSASAAGVLRMLARRWLVERGALAADDDLRPIQKRGDAPRKGK